jgi:hypothetical protein
MPVDAALPVKNGNAMQIFLWAALGLEVLAEGQWLSPQGRWA